MIECLEVFLLYKLFCFRLPDRIICIYTKINHSNMAHLNQELSAIFSRMANMYRFTGEKDQYRVRAYENAAQALANLPDDVREYAKNKDLEAINGIGKSTAEKIKEYLDTGQIARYEELQKIVPLDFIDLLSVKNIGPETLKYLHDALGVNTKKDLKKVLENGEAAQLKGFGEKKAAKILKELSGRMNQERRFLLPDAERLAEDILEALKPLSEIKKIEVAGSLRRRKDTVGDLDILVAAEHQDRKKIMETFTQVRGVKEVLAKGESKSSIVVGELGCQVDLRIVEEDQWGAALFYFTGSKGHNVHIRNLAKAKDWKVNEYGLFREEDDKILASREEKDIYDAMKMQYVPPELREDRGEVEVALEHKLPQLIEMEDIQGDLHMHSNWSDGGSSIEELVEFVQKHLPYAYIALTDHSQAVRVAGGLDAQRVERQLKAIEKVNRALGKNFIKPGIEVDILKDGKLDLPNELLAQLSWVVGSLHIPRQGDNTGVLISACENPYVCVIGHPTGRLLNRRAPYEVEMEKVIKAAAETGTALEINAQPKRMDLNDVLARQAKEQGVKLVISTDTHYLRQFSNIRYGVAVARRAWCTKDDVLNTLPWKDLVAHINQKREKLGVKERVEG